MRYCETALYGFLRTAPHGIGLLFFYARFFYAPATNFFVFFTGSRSLAGSL